MANLCNQIFPLACVVFFLLTPNRNLNESIQTLVADIRKLSVGIIGASGGSARISHVPAVRELSGLELTAVAARDQTSADSAAREFGATLGYGNATEMFKNPTSTSFRSASRFPIIANLSSERSLRANRFTANGL